MAFYLAHGGSKLYKVDVNGDVTELSLPSGVTLSSSRPARFGILNRQIVMVNAPSRPIQIDPNLVVRILTPTAPAAGLAVGASGSGSFTGDFDFVVTYAIVEGDKIVSESDASAAVTVTAASNSQFDLTSIPTSSDPGVNARIVYRSVVGPGEVLYKVSIIYDNTTTTYTDTTTDAALPLNDILNDALGDPPGNILASERLEILTAWKDRMWGLATSNPDNAYFTGNLQPWAWSPDNFVTAKPAGQDLEGGTAFAPRRDELGIGKRRSLWKVIGDDETNFQMIRVAAETGIWAPLSMVIIRDEAYFLGEDGLYKWGPGGLRNLSEDKVHSWFTSNSYFNRAMFPLSFGKWNQRNNTYELHVAAAGSSSVDRWISFDLKDESFLGPHKTDAFTPSCAGVLEDDDGLVVPFIGATNGKIYKQNQDTFTDDGTAIDFDVYTKRHSQAEPDREKYWGQLTVHTKSEAAGTLTITPAVGDIDASPGSAISHDLTNARQRHRRLGTGKHLQLRFRNNEDNQGCEIRGYEVDPVKDLGRR